MIDELEDLELDLHKQFRATEQFLENSLPGAPPANSEMLALFADASFLFESEVEAYMRMAMTKRGELTQINLRAAANQGIVRANDIARDNELVQWFTNESGGGCRQVFAPYLDFSEWR